MTRADRAVKQRFRFTVISRESPWVPPTWGTWGARAFLYAYMPIICQARPPASAPFTGSGAVLVVVTEKGWRWRHCIAMPRR